ncbi:hypothetical protein GACE_0959 [Geoglobus acetivorans]|uniref:FIST domain-containing protein n=1 Tax=Geoglobus acetivorans TaxID=565033 RepID=A0A0A7GD55_GEOAI|nr:hypothetical protein GACE_0959 [Geoglobus acetivorans]
MKSIIADIEHKLKKVDFSPNLSVVIITQSLFENRNELIDFLKKLLVFNSIIFFVDGFGTNEGIFMHGIAIVLLEIDHDIYVTGRGNLEKELEKIAGKIKGHDVALAIYPALYFPGKMALFKGFLRDRLYWFRYRRCKDEGRKRRILKAYSNWVQKERLFIPVNKVLRILGKSGIPVGSINLVPLEVHEETPLILYNFRPIGQNVLVLAIKDAELHFKDIFPERGNSVEETRKILSSFFALKDEVRVIKEGNVIGEINGMPVKDYIREKLGFEITQEEFIERVEGGNFSGISPYGLALISRKTFGTSVIGLTGYPLNFYPYFLDLDVFEDSGLILGEIFVESPEEFVFFDSIVGNNACFRIFFVDSTTLLAYRGDTYRMYDFLCDTCKGDWLLIFTSASSAKMIKDYNSKKFLSEIDGGICYFSSGTSLMVELKE